MVLDFDPQNYGAAVAELVRDDLPDDLGPGTANSDVLSLLRAMDGESLFAERRVVDTNMAACCVSGLWLLHNFLDESHRISQTIHTTSGSYWHGIMHRREPDFSNSKYWFRSVAAHDVFPRLNAVARSLAGEHELDSESTYLAQQEKWDAFRFVDFCQAAIQGGSENEELCLKIAQAEWRLLFDFCYQNAIGQ